MAKTSKHKKNELADNQAAVPSSVEPGNVLPSIDRLLNAVSDLMKQEPNIDRQAFEHMRQLRVRIRFAISNAEKGKVAKSALRTPVKWVDRDQKSESPVEFIKREYAAGISRPEIRALDKSLYAALSNWISKHGLPNDFYIPTKSQIGDLKLKSAGSVKAPSRSKRVSEMAVADVEKLRLYDLARQRKK